MAFKIKKDPAQNSVQKRISIPTDVWQAVELVAKRDQVDENEVVRQVLAHTLRAELKEVRESRKESADAEN